MFRCMGTEIDLRVGGVPQEQARRALRSGRVFMRGFDAGLSRFRPDSELSRLNDDPRESVPVSQLMAEMIEAMTWAAGASGGLVDPTLLPALEREGYDRDFEQLERADLADALSNAPEPRRAHPDPAELWRSVQLDHTNRRVSRPPGLRLDSGGSGKGLAADLLASIWHVTLGDRARFLIDCGGDIRFGGPSGERDVNVAHPLGGPATKLRVTRAAVATSGIGRRVWRRPDGSFAHHLIDPATGEPAWSGLLSVTAVADSALAAETVAKTAFLRGAEEARALLAADGGVLFHASGEVEHVAPSELIAA